MRIGVSELIVVLIVALLVLGPDKLPRYARKVGAALAEFRKASDAAAREIRENVVEPLEEAQRPLREAMEPVEAVSQAVQSNWKDVQKSLNNLGKPGPRKASGTDADAPPSNSDAEASETVTTADAEASETVTAETVETAATPDAASAIATEEGSHENRSERIIVDTADSGHCVRADADSQIDPHDGQERQAVQGRIG